jgi:hypothetical protein
MYKMIEKVRMGGMWRERERETRACVVHKVGLLGALALGVVGVDLIGKEDIREAELALTKLEGGALLGEHLERASIASLVSHHLISLLHL